MLVWGCPVGFNCSFPASVNGAFFLTSLLVCVASALTLQFCVPWIYAAAAPVHPVSLTLLCSWVGEKPVLSEVMHPPPAWIFIVDGQSSGSIICCLVPQRWNVHFAYLHIFKAFSAKQVVVFPLLISGWDVEQRKKKKKIKGLNGTVCIFYECLYFACVRVGTFTSAGSTLLSCSFRTECVSVCVLWRSPQGLFRLGAKNTEKLWKSFYALLSEMILRKGFHKEKKNLFIQASTSRRVLTQLPNSFPLFLHPSIPPLFLGGSMQALLWAKSMSWSNVGHVNKRTLTHSLLLFGHIVTSKQNKTTYCLTNLTSVDYF